MSERQKFLAEQPVIAAIIANLFLLLITDMLLSGLVLTVLSSFLPAGELKSNLYIIITIPLAFALIILVFSRFYPISLLGLSGKGLGRGLVLGLPGLLLSPVLLFVVFFLPHILRMTEFAPFTWASALGVLALFFHACGEELTSRGVTLNILYQGWGHSRAGIYRALLVSGLLFGLGHLPTYLTIYKQPPLTLAMILLLQIASKASFSVFIGALYLRSRNLWVVGIWHGFNNLLMSVPAILQQSGYSILYGVTSSTVSGEVLPAYLQQSLFVLPLLPLGLFLARKVELLPPAESAAEDKTVVPA